MKKTLPLLMSFIILYSGCNFKMGMVSQCVSCVNEYNKSEELLNKLYNIQEFGYVDLPGFRCDYKTLEEKLGFKLDPKLDQLAVIDTCQYYFRENRIHISYYFHDEEIADAYLHNKLITNDYKDLSIYKEEMMILGIKSMCHDSISTGQIKTALQQFGYDLIKTRLDVGAVWFYGHEDYIEFNCISGYKRLIYTKIQDISNLPYNHKFIMKINENWYYYDVKIKDKNKDKYIKTIYDIKKRYGWQ